MIEARCGTEVKNTLRGREFYLDIARAVAIISITCNHAINRSVYIGNGQYEDFFNHSICFSCIKAALYVFTRIGVPLFLMISGALLLNKRMDNDRDIKHFYHHNLLDLFITAELWYVIMYWFIVLFNPENMILETGGIFKALRGMVLTTLFLDQTTMGSMWYMPMIMCIYITIPFVAIIKNKVSYRWLFIPLILVYLRIMVLPAINDFFSFFESYNFSSVINEYNLMSRYYIYVFAGYCVSQGKLSWMKTWHIIGVAIISFALCCIYQVLAFSKSDTIYIGYSFPLLPICSAALLELFRRKEDVFKALRKPITYLATISFGIYFVHIFITEALNWYMDFSGWYPYCKLIFLEIVSFCGSIMLIYPLSKIPFFKKRMFMIKN